MAKIKITKELINSIVRQDHKKYINKLNKKVNQVLATSINLLSNKVSYINLKNVVLQPMNEILNGSFVDNSKFIYFLGIDNAQLELNSTKSTNFWRNFKERLKFAWENRKTFKKKKRRQRRRRKEEQKMTTINFDPSKYNMYALSEDLQNSLCSILTESTIISLKDCKLSIIGREDFECNTEIVIYLVSNNSESFKFYSSNKKGFTEINLNSRIDKFNEKLQETGENLIKIMKIFNTLYYNVNGKMPNQVYLESVLYFVPSQLYQGDDIYKAFLKVVNYLKLKSIRNINSVNDMSKNINNDVICGNCGLEFNKVLNLL